MIKVLMILTSNSNQYKALESLLNKEDWKVLFLATLDIKLLDERSKNTNEQELNCLAILNPFNYSFSRLEQASISKFCHSGHSLIVAGGSNEDKTNKSNLNSILKEFGVRFNYDCVIRPNPYRQYHPKEAQLEDSIVNRGLSDSIKKYSRLHDDDYGGLKIGELDNSGAKILYANGCTIKVIKKTSTIMMTSSKWALPSQQATCTFYKDFTNNCRVVVIGCAPLMSDDYIDKEDNKALIKALLDFIVHKEFSINISDARTIEIPESSYTPNINELLDTPISCLQESQHLPEDKASLIDKKLFKIDNSNVPAIVRAFRDLNVSNKPLTLIKPNLESSPFELEPATHDFLLRTFPK